MTNIIADERHFLGVGRSVTGRSWLPRLADSRAALTISQRHDLPEILGRVLAGRGVTPDEALRHLNPTLRELMPQARELNDLDKGARRLVDAVRNGERIGIIGDYDVDGVTSTALLVRFLRAIGSDAEIHIPDRLTEGYGPSRSAVESLKGKGVKLLVTLDCGVMAHDPLLLAGELGMDTLVVDHHQAGALLPDCHALINPNRQDDLSGLGFMSAVGVTLCLVAAANRMLREEGWYGAGARTRSPAAARSRGAGHGVRRGAASRPQPRLCDPGAEDPGEPRPCGACGACRCGAAEAGPDAYALGYLLGPRLNAAGRVGHAMRRLIFC